MKKMDPKTKIVNGVEETIVESAEELQQENKKISEKIISSEPRIPDVTGLNTDTTVVNRVIDNNE
jgi:hypothetical protein